MLKSNIINFSTARSFHIDKRSDFTPSVLVNLSISYKQNTHYQPIKKRYIYRVLMNTESENMSLIPYIFHPEYSIEEIINSTIVNI